MRTRARVVLEGVPGNLHDESAVILVQIRKYIPSDPTRSALFWLFFPFLLFFALVPSSSLSPDELALSLPDSSPSPRSSSSKSTYRSISAWINPAQRNWSSSASTIGIGCFACASSADREGWKRMYKLSRHWNAYTGGQYTTYMRLGLDSHCALRPLPYSTASQPQTL
jgi:hypothetical protein